MRTRLVVAALVLVAAQFPLPSRAQWVLNGAPVCTAVGNQVHPVAVPDGAGGAIIAWSDARTSASGDIYAQRLDPFGHALWAPDGVAVCTQADYQDVPSIVSDGSGGAIIAWMDRRATTHYDLYAQRVNASGVPQWTPDGVVLCGASGSQYYPLLATDGAGGAYAVWFDDRTNGLNHDVYAGRLSSAGVALDGLLGVAITNTLSLDEDHQTIVPVSGGVLITWNDRRNGNFDVYGARFSSGGSLLDPAGIAICTDPSASYGQAGIPDGSGGVIVAWMEGRIESVYAQRVNSSGVVQWAPNGVAIGSPIYAAVEGAPRMVADGAGGAIIAWPRVDAFNLNLYAQHIDGTGARQWLPVETKICDAPNEQLFGGMVSDGAGGAVMVWKDSRTNADIYAQRVRSNGVVDWAPNGVPVCSDPAKQDQPVAVSDGAGGAIAVWTDQRPIIPTDIYAQRIRSDGNIVTGVGETLAAGLALLPAQPNPFEGTTSFDLRLDKPSDVSIRVYDVGGRRVRSIVLPGLAAGRRTLTLSARDDRGRALPAGVYFLRVEAAHAVATEKIVLLK